MPPCPQKRRYSDDDTLRVADVTQRFFTFSQFHGILRSAEWQSTKGYDTMEKNGRKLLFAGCGFMAACISWTMLIQTVDVQPVGQNGTNIGFAGVNQWFHKLTGVHMTLYTVTDWLGLVPIAVCMGFGVLGFIQLVRRKSLFKVDSDLLLLGVYYALVIAGYLIFEIEESMSKKNVSVSATLLAYASDGSVIGKSSDDITLTEGKYNFFRYSFDGDVSSAQIQANAQAKNDSFMTGERNAVEMVQYNMSGEDLYVTFEQTGDELGSFAKFKLLFYKGDQIVDTEDGYFNIYAENLNGKGSTDVASIWVYGIDYDRIEYIFEP